MKGYYIPVSRILSLRHELRVRPGQTLPRLVLLDIGRQGDFLLGFRASEQAMDGGGSSGGGNQGDGGDASMPWASLGGDAPLPPVFGNANAQAAGGDMDFKVGRAAPPILICRLDTRYTRTQEMDQCHQSCTLS